MSSLLGALRSAPSAVGEITLYRLFDVGYEIDLGRASERLAGSGPERARPTRGEAQAIQIANPPVNVRLGLEPVEVDGALQPAELSARLFDFGVVSLRATFSMEEPRPWGEWAATGARIGTQDAADRPENRPTQPLTPALAASQRARSSDSAHTTAAATIAYGCCRNVEGRKCWRYSANAGSVLAGLKWCANANGRPSIPATWAL